MTLNLNLKICMQVPLLQVTTKMPIKFLFAIFLSSFIFVKFISRLRNIFVMKSNIVTTGE